MRWIALLLPAVLLVAVSGPPGFAADKQDPKEAESYIKVEAKGKLQTGIVAIGGETTGIVLATKNGALELDLGKDKDLRAMAQKLDGKTVVVTGTLTIRRGVEVRQRLIVQVDKLKAVEEKEK